MSARLSACSEYRRRPLLHLRPRLQPHPSRQCCNITASRQLHRLRHLHQWYHQIFMVEVQLAALVTVEGAVADIRPVDQTMDMMTRTLSTKHRRYWKYPRKSMRCERLRCKYSSHSTRRGYVMEYVMDYGVAYHSVCGGLTFAFSLGRYIGWLCSYGALWYGSVDALAPSHSVLVHCSAVLVRARGLVVAACALCQGSVCLYCGSQ
jgi:hypothetical protein